MTQREEALKLIQCAMTDLHLTTSCRLPKHIDDEIEAALSHLRKIIAEIQKIGEKMISKHCGEYLQRMPRTKENVKCVWRCRVCNKYFYQRKRLVKKENGK